MKEARNHAVIELARKVEAAAARDEWSLLRDALCKDKSRMCSPAFAITCGSETAGPPAVAEFRTVREIAQTND
jgi:hypothetical protein